jgi:hypothetical protein
VKLRPEPAGSAADPVVDATSPQGATPGDSRPQELPAPAVDKSAAEAARLAVAASEDFSSVGSAHETRYGNGLARITQVEIRKPRGGPVRVLEVGERYEMRFVAEARADIGATAYGFIISNAKGQEVYGTKSGLFGLEVPPLRAGESVCCAMDIKLDVVPGRYLLTVALAHNDKDSDYEFLDYRFDVLEFQVIGTPTGFLTSIASLPAQLRHELVPTAHAASAD